MDAWPETFYQALPKPLRKLLGPLLLAPLHRSARRAYQGADKITAVGQSYLKLSQKYLGEVPSSKFQIPTKNQEPKASKPMFLCYHGTDLSRFQRDGLRNPNSASQKPRPENQGTRNEEQRRQPLKAVYLGSMGQGYDLMTILKVAARWKAEGRFPLQIHFAGTGTQLSKLKAETGEHGLIQATNHQSSAINHQSSAINDSPRIVFHGQLNKDSVDELLLSSAIALVPNKPDSLVACPYKAGEYAAAGLPMLSCLDGELNQLLSEWNAGSKYTEGDAASLQAAFERYLTNRELLNQHSQNAREMAETLFDRNQTYAALAEFMLDSSFRV
jgi:glycosyltransferase involved in cell wall biosynthesis